MKVTTSRLHALVGGLIGLVVAGAVAAQPLGHRELLKALQGGGYVLLMRHASSPHEPPAGADVKPDNTGHERQLDAPGIAAATTMGEAFRQLHIPIGAVISSPTYRALETVRYAGLGTAATAAELGDGGQSMLADATGARGAWLHARVTELPARGKNDVLITHFPNIREAFPEEAASLADGEALVLKPDGHGGARVVAHVKIDEWPRLGVGN